MRPGLIVGVALVSWNKCCRGKPCGGMRELQNVNHKGTIELELPSLVENT